MSLRACVWMRCAEGDRTTASWVAFNDDGRIVGDAAKRQAAMNTQRTFFNIKRIIGRDFRDCHEEIKRMPFKVEKVLPLAWSSLTSAIR